MLEHHGRFGWFVFGLFSAESGDCGRGTQFFWFVLEKKKILCSPVLHWSAPIADVYGKNARDDRREGRNKAILRRTPLTLNGPIVILDPPTLAAAVAREGEAAAGSQLGRIEFEGGFP